MTNVIDFAEARERLRPPPLQWQLPDSIRKLSLDERMYLPQSQLPYVSGLPTAFLEGRWP